MDRHLCNGITERQYYAPFLDSSPYASRHQHWRTMGSIRAIWLKWHHSGRHDIFYYHGKPRIIFCLSTKIQQRKCHIRYRSVFPRTTRSLSGKAYSKHSAAKLRNDVQICISDNASTDGTSTLLKKLGNSTQNIKYKIQPSNLGPDKNYFEAVRLADAEYCWLMGSDDEIEEDSLAKILEEIENSKNKIYLAPRVNCSITMERLNTEHWLADTTKKYYDFTEKKEEMNISTKQSTLARFSAT